MFELLLKLGLDLTIPIEQKSIAGKAVHNIGAGTLLVCLAEQIAAAEVEALPILARGSALRFMLTRLVDWLNVPPGAKVTPKNPLEYLVKMRFHQRVVSARDYGRLA